MEIAKSNRIFLTALLQRKIKAPSTRIRRFLYPQIFFMRIQKYLRAHVAYTNRIRPSTHIRFVSGHLKGLVNRACALRLVLILWRQRIQKYTNTSVHTYPDTQRTQKFPLWRAYTEISGYTERIRRTRVDAIWVYPHKKICGYKNLRIRVDGA